MKEREVREQKKEIEKLEKQLKGQQNTITNIKARVKKFLQKHVERNNSLQDVLQNWDAFGGTVPTY